MRRNWDSCALLVEVKNCAATVDTVWQFLKKQNVESLHDPAIPLRVYTQKTERL